ncbi:MAG: hypothetical protein IPJ31_15115 [Bacteroidetes bacterium]|nr:hypothetical protein [Bacteroidota bacterium]
MERSEVMKRMKERFIVASLFADVDNISLPESEQYDSKFLGSKVTSIGDKNEDIQATKFNSNSFIDENENKLADKGYGYDPNPALFVKHLMRYWRNTKRPQESFLFSLTLSFMEPRVPLHREGINPFHVFIHSTIFQILFRTILILDSNYFLQRFLVFNTLPILPLVKSIVLFKKEFYYFSFPFIPFVFIPILLQAPFCILSALLQFSSTIFKSRKNSCVEWTYLCVGGVIDRSTHRYVYGLFLPKA